MGGAHEELADTALRDIQQLVEQGRWCGIALAGGVRAQRFGMFTGRLQLSADDLSTRHASSGVAVDDSAISLTSHK